MACTGGEPPIGPYRPPITSSTSSISSAASSLPNSSTVQRSLMPSAALSTRSRGTNLPASTRCFGSMTRCVTVLVAGSMITRITLPPGPSTQLALAPIANSVSSATAAFPRGHRGHRLIETTRDWALRLT